MRTSKGKLARTKTRSLAYARKEVFDLVSTDMRLSKHERDRVLEFCAAIKPVISAYAKSSTLSYFCVRSGNEWELVKARILLNTGSAKDRGSTFSSKQVRAGSFLISDLNRSIEQLLSEFLTGRVSLPAGKFQFKPGDNGTYSCHFTPLQDEGLRAGNRTAALTITGKNRYIDTLSIDWGLKASKTPYDGLSDLLSTHGLGTQVGHNAVLEVVAFQVAAIDVTSEVAGDMAKPRIILAKGLATQKASIGYRLFAVGKATARSSIAGRQMNWRIGSDFQYGTAEVAIPVGGVLHCYACYEGIAQHQYWLADPSSFQNPKRAAYEAFDPGLQVLREYIAKSRNTQRDSSDFEAAMAWILWMLGFSVVQLGLTKRTREAPDIVCTTPSGHILVVECTTGTLKAEHKLSNLIDRVAAIRRKLEASGNRHVNVLPMIVTTKTRDEVAADLEQAERLGVLVQTSESFESAIGRTLVQANADQIFADGMREVADAKRAREARHTT